MMTNGGRNGNVKQLRQCEKESSQVTTNPSFKKVIIATNPAPVVFRYIPKSCCKDSKAPFSKCITLESTTKPISKFKETNCHILGDRGVLTTHKASQSMVPRGPLSSFVISSKGSL